MANKFDQSLKPCIFTYTKAKCTRSLCLTKYCARVKRFAKSLRVPETVKCFS